ncbi:NAD(P) transhydrogenase subunit alpha [Uliginosibacterium sp. H1]|uniref:NAD(P) transhydrogenase subunit alpha n=1 Tax=Uliginosibacterium sp. H1 TaxID=3114757 RepID=UPI002E18542D|nr:NAD(P) transhydrogenase subunit alpha [Uliginosibacterium sp. H1]
MALTLGVLQEADQAERRVPLVADVVKKYRQAGATIVIQSGAGTRAHIDDAAFGDVQALPTAEAVLAQSDILLTVTAPSLEVIDQMKHGSVLLGMLQPYASENRVQKLLSRGITSFAMELLPRISRAQSMDILSSQAACAGYQCVLIAASHCPKFFPMLTYAAGTIRPSKVLVIGAGVAGLQAIATAKRLGAMVEAYDVRPETREQIESLGAKFVDTGVSAAGSGGYARELTEEEKQQQADRLAKAVAQCDVLITTAAIPGKCAPRIITAAMVAGMKPGSVVVDMAAESGGNVEGTVSGDVVQVGPATLVGPSHLPSRMATHASDMFARNLFNFIGPMIKDGELKLDWEDEVLAGACLTHEGALRHEGVKKALGL